MSLCKAQEVGILVPRLWKGYLSQTWPYQYILRHMCSCHADPCTNCSWDLSQLTSCYQCPRHWADLSFKYEESKRDTKTLALLLLQGRRGKIHTSLSGYNAFLFKCTRFLNFTRQSLLKKNVVYFVTFSIICIGILLSHRKGQRHCLDK